MAPLTWTSKPQPTAAMAQKKIHHANCGCLVKTSRTVTCLSKSFALLVVSSVVSDSADSMCSWAVGFFSTRSSMVAEKGELDTERKSSGLGEGVFTALMIQSNGLVVANPMGKISRLYITTHIPVHLSVKSDLDLPMLGHPRPSVCATWTSLVM
jgi:hypothetical protein